jgi:hypothetical protein
MDSTLYNNERNEEDNENKGMEKIIVDFQKRFRFDEDSI